MFSAELQAVQDAINGFVQAAGVSVDRVDIVNVGTERRVTIASDTGVECQMSLDCIVLSADPKAFGAKEGVRHAHTHPQYKHTL